MTAYPVALATKRDSKHWTMDTVSWDDLISWVENPGTRKEAGNYVLGTLEPTTVRHPGAKRECTNLHRNKRAVRDRWCVTLDVDHPRRGFFDEIQLLWQHRALLHTTHSSTPDEPRYRMLVPLDRTVTPEEYSACAIALMDQLGAKQFDHGSREPERYMFKPAAKRPEWYRHLELPGEPYPVDELLAAYEESLQGKELPAPPRNKRDPFELTGIPGAFNRAYPELDELIEAYELPYERSGADRWHLVGARSAGGMGQVTPGLYFSHHAGDPAGGQTCSAFDLVRLHRFSDLDEEAPDGTPIVQLPSHKAMCDLASQDTRVVADFVGAEFDKELDDIVEDDRWRAGFILSTRTGKVEDVVHNWDLIRDNDAVFQALFFNEMTLAVEIDRDLPWRTYDADHETFTATDRAEFLMHIEREYGFRPAKWYLDGLVDAKAAERKHNPVRDYLDGLEWDGTPRLEECLPGVRPTAFTRMVARKSMVAAVARIFQPGCKWDHTLVLFGSEGLGKSYWMDKMSRGYSAPLGRIGDKDTLIAMQRSWIMVSDEGHSLRKADAEAQKEFLTRTEDVFRLPYEREAQAHKRHSVIWSATNDEVFLRRQEGNRRFLIVHCEERVDFAQLTDQYVDQVWAEAVHRYRAGEVLFLDETESETAAAERERFIEEDALQGIIENYLSTLVPGDWAGRSIQERQVWLEDQANGLVRGTEPITEVCSVQLWTEALGRRFGEHNRIDLLTITESLKRIPGWVARPGRHRVPNYGPQMVFQRLDGADLL